MHGNSQTTLTQLPAGHTCDARCAARGHTPRASQSAVPPRDTRSAIDKFEAVILESGGRMVGSAGRYGSRRDDGNGVSVGYYVTGDGRPVILHEIRGQSVEVFVPVTASPRMDDTLAALAEYAASRETVDFPRSAPR